MANTDNGDWAVQQRMC